MKWSFEGCFFSLLHAQLSWSFFYVSQKHLLDDFISSSFHSRPHRAWQHCENFIVCDIFLSYRKIPLFFLPLHLHQDSACMMICNGKCNAISRLTFSSSSWLKPKPKKRLLNWIKYMEKEALSVLWINQWSICCWTMIRRCRQAAMECDGTATRRTRSNDSHGSGGDIMTMFTLWKIAVLYFFFVFLLLRNTSRGGRSSELAVGTSSS